ncbi:hypothetical protein B0H15DRAFT_955810 [Mycena belliarum]|uniref:Uncharacterized protein n=1 Tax=Mycena belliarum TaxID=1033014 RepID=A0AAD6XK83_9AGAR|nr:hypothetical protein B0H15DRAFT_955810 [Mycena belliae]
MILRTRVLRLTPGAPPLDGSITARPAFRGGVNGLLAETPDDAAGIGEKLDVLRCPSANQIHAQAAAHF